jgi:hypothetical protein
MEITLKITIKMEKYYITLASGQKVRTLWNDEATIKFKNHTGSDISILADGSLRIKELQYFAWIAIIEGEKSDGREFLLTLKEFIPQFTLPAAIEFNKNMVKLAFSQN